ncbi:hypothetical protein MCOR27_002988 [Pyricularia oryzae]|nr:hypothetical protein MCOR26_009958 [Pyricularia oryzae]KAI6284114.1 hypothetical protein MCOR27_002988 [Pyricularia oryzae]KAI6369793.1 hypothetical protein MCOR31_004942 [Pyricularia oryzae]KAI6472666.1 hypothetical protein MCOR18_008474 [Pyricularia oryzae]KAI6476421.1 hypothetical protein MCOR13_011828 [Pyricularia oryzae]
MMYPVSYFRVDVVNTPPGRPRSSSVSSLSRVGGHRTAAPATQPGMCCFANRHSPPLELYCGHKCSYYLHVTCFQKQVPPE